MNKKYYKTMLAVWSEEPLTEADFLSMFAGQSVVCVFRSCRLIEDPDLDPEFPLDFELKDQDEFIFLAHQGVVVFHCVDDNDVFQDFHFSVNLDDLNVDWPATYDDGFDRQFDVRDLPEPAEAFGIPGYANARLRIKKAIDDGILTADGVKAS